MKNHGAVFPFTNLAKKVSSNDETDQVVLIGIIASEGWEKYYEEEVVTPTSVLRTLQQTNSQASNLDVFLSSPGGDTMAGLTTKSYIDGVSLKKNVTVYVSGLVASMGTILMQTGAQTVADPNSVFMIHKVIGGIRGNGDEIKKYLEFMEKHEDQLIDIYVDAAKRRGKMRGTRTNTAKNFKQLMSNETWLTAKEALELGLIDRIATLPIEFQEIQNSQPAQAAYEAFANNLSDAAKDSLAAILNSSNSFQMFSFLKKNSGSDAGQGAETQMTQEQVEQFNTLVNNVVAPQFEAFAEKMEAAVQQAFNEFQEALAEEVAAAMKGSLESRDQQINALLDKVEGFSNQTQEVVEAAKVVHQRATLGSSQFTRVAAAAADGKEEGKKGDEKFSFGFNRVSLKNALVSSLNKAEA